MRRGRARWTCSTLSLNQPGSVALDGGRNALFAVQDRIAYKFYEGEDDSVLNQDEMDLYVYQQLRDLVDNGGFHQFFSNSPGSFGSRAKIAISRIRPPELIALYDCVLTAFPDSVPSEDRLERWKQLDAWGDDQYKPFETFDSAFTRSTTNCSRVHRPVSC